MKMHVYRRASKRLLVGVLLLVLLVAAPPAFANPPAHDPIEPAHDVYSACPHFDVQMDDVRTDEKLMTMTKNDGSTMFLITGNLITTFTNVDNKKSITLKIPGSFHEVDYPDGSVHVWLTGRSVFFNLPEPLTYLTLVDGRVDWTLDAAGNISPLTINGSVTNLCDLLAD